MKKRLIDGIKVQRSSGNVYADPGLPDPERLEIRAGLVVEIRKAMRRLELTQQEAAKHMGITQPKVSDVMRGDFSNLYERKLMDGLNRLGDDIGIKVKPASAPAIILPRDGPRACASCPAPGPWRPSSAACGSRGSPTC